MLDNVFAGLQILGQWQVVLYLLAGTVSGMVFGALPGLGGPTVVALIIPLTFGMDANSALLLLASSMGGVAFGGSISAILINTPGTAPNAATCFDGYPMARRGEANVAIGAAATASALGAIFGLVVFLLILPFAAKFLLSFSYAENLTLALFGLSTIAIVSEGSVAKGLIAGAFGMLLSFVGRDLMTGRLRYTFDSLYLQDGISLLPVLIGLFALGEIIGLLVKGKSIQDLNMTDRQHSGIRDTMRGVAAVFQNFFLFLRCSALGTLIGAIPGLGGTVANFLAYLHAKQTSKDGDTFGKGNIKGVIASESSNDAKDGGAMLPTILFGLPGSATWAVLLGGFVLHGVAPGPQLVHTHPELIFILIAGLLVSNILTSVIGILLASHLAKLIKIPVLVLAPVIFATGLIGAYASNGKPGNIVVAAIFGFVGYGMKKYNYPRVSVIIGLILGPIAEASYFQLNYSSQSLWSRPIAMGFLFLTIAMLLIPLFKLMARKIRSGSDRRSA